MRWIRFAKGKITRSAIQCDSGLKAGVLLEVRRKPLTNNKQLRILIGRLSAIGDTVQTVPVLCALREALPQAYIAWITQPSAAQLLEGHNALDRLMIVSKGWLTRPKHCITVAKRLRQEKFDVFIDVQSLSKSALLGWLAKARWRIGFARPMGRELAPRLDNVLVHPSATHMVERYLELLQPLGIGPAAVRFDLPLWPEAARSAEVILKQLIGCQRVAIINPGASWPSKLWPPDRFAAVASHVYQRWGVKSIVVWAGSGEHEIAKQVVRLAPEAACLAPETSLRELAELARRAAVFISSDTGPIHIAAAVGTPCVGLYGPWPADRHGPYGSQHICVEKMRFEGPSHLRRRLPPTYMEAIDVQSVCNACDQILGKQSSSKAA